MPSVRTKKPPGPPEPQTIPFRILVDGREQQPYQFHEIYADKQNGGHRLIIPWDWAHLQTGDYSIEGYSDQITIERKSLNDLYFTLSAHRERFEEEHRRLVEFKFKAVVIEAGWRDILENPPPKSRFNPKAVFRTFISWSLTKYHVPWIAVDCRRLAEVTTFRLLDRWWRELNDTTD